MKKYADKIFIAITAISLCCLVVQAPFMLEAQEAEKVYWEQNSKKWRQEFKEEIRKEIQEEEVRKQKE